MTEEAVWKGTEQLLLRLPRLLDERKANSHQSHLAYPTTVRVTARVVDPRLLGTDRNTKGNDGLQKRTQRPFVTTCRQRPFSGRSYMDAGTTENERRDMLLNTIRPLVVSMVLRNKDIPRINLTRLNVCATNFRDMDVDRAATAGRQQSLLQLSSSNDPSQRKTDDTRRNKTNSFVLGRKVRKIDPVASTAMARANADSSRNSEEPREADSGRNKAEGWCGTPGGSETLSQVQRLSPKNPNRSLMPAAASYANEQSCASTASIPNPGRSMTSPGVNMGICVDPSVLAELPPDIAAEVRETYCIDTQPTKRRRIDDFFKRRKES